MPLNSKKAEKATRFPQIKRNSRYYETDYPKDIVGKSVFILISAIVVISVAYISQTCVGSLLMLFVVALAAVLTGGVLKDILFTKKTRRLSHNCKPGHKEEV